MEIETILVSNNEDFSADLDEISILGATDFPPPENKWVEVGSIKPVMSTKAGHVGVHLLNLAEQALPMVRYLKVSFRGQNNSEDLICTLTNL